MSNRVISRLRRNHALEHATMHVLAERHQPFSAQGNSTFSGFHLNIYGPVSREEVAEAAAEAHKRLKAGEERLAIQPNCGTVLLTTATMATLAAQATFTLEQRRQKRSSLSPSVLVNALPSAVLAVAVSLIVSRPLGMAIQAAYTVEPDLRDLEIVSVRRAAPSAVTRLFQLMLGQSNNRHVHAYHVRTRY
jgi:hypothetical protein